MSGDEAFAMLVCGLVAVAAWGGWYSSTVSATPLGSSRHFRFPLYVAPLLCGVALLVVLRYFASHDVRDNPIYLGFYLLMGAAWVGMIRWVLPSMGISPRDDALERRNLAASIAVMGALLGITFCFAGGNVGDGPGWWVVVFSAALSTAVFLLLWAIIERVTRIADAITIDRDLAAGYRLSGILIAAGLILGRGVAGDWVSLRATVLDFVTLAWPVLPLVAAEMVLGLIFRPSPSHPTHPALACGLIPASIYIAVASLFVWGIGAW
jgi:uncharacterized membrane protein YjfL (UPF0719 family)